MLRAALDLRLRRVLLTLDLRTTFVVWIIAGAKETEPVIFAIAYANLQDGGGLIVGPAFVALPGSGDDLIRLRRSQSRPPAAAPAADRATGLAMEAPACATGDARRGTIEMRCKLGVARDIRAIWRARPENSINGKFFELA